MKWIKRLFYVLASLYLLACVVLYFQQERLLFHPRQRAATHAYGNGTEVELTAADGTTLNTVLVDVADERGVVLFFHGNRGDNGRAIYQSRAAAEAGYDLMVFDYRGYGKSEGSISSEPELLADAQLAYDYLKARYAESDIHLVGYSLGTGPASYLAAENKPARLVLAAPYVSLAAMKDQFLWMVPDFILKYPMNSREWLGRSVCPVTIVHGTADELIPFAMAEEMAALDAQRIELVALPGVGHRGVVLSGGFRNVLAR